MNQKTLNEVFNFSPNYSQPNTYQNGVIVGLYIAYKKSISESVENIPYNIIAESIEFHSLHGERIASAFSTLSPIEIVCDNLINIFIEKWKRFYDILKLEYNPIENYSMTEQEDIVDDGNTDGDNNNTLYVNSFDGGRSEKTHNASDYGNSSHATRGRSLNRSGNIGVTTSQQMLQSEIEIRSKRFIQFVYDDLKNTLTIPIWKE